MIYPVITLHQPWATWIMREWKEIETRTHGRFASLQGKTILIHAGKKTDATAKDNIFLTKEQLLYKPEEIINGHILGSAYVDATGWLCGDEYENEAALIETTNRYRLFLQDVEKFIEPIPEQGERGIWYYNLDKKQKVRKP